MKLIIPLFSLYISFISCLLSSEIEYLGRWNINTSPYTSEWEGSRITFTLQIKTLISSTITIKLISNNIKSFSTYLGLEINCKYIQKYQFNNEKNSILIELQNVKENEIYDISLVKLTESYYSDSYGTISFDDIIIDNGSGNIIPRSSQSCYNHQNKLLFIGDSITAAYGVEGSNEFCHYSASTQNVLDSYAFLVAQNVNAFAHTLAWSGKGVVRNYGDVNPTSVDPMPIYYNRTFASSSDPSNYWNPSNYIPDIVIISLGANDYSTQPNPSDYDFQNGLTNFISVIRNDYQNIQILLLCEPGSNGNQCSNIQKVSENTGVFYVKVPDDVVVSFGCDYHPSIQAQINMANVVTPVVQDILSKVKKIN